MSPSISIFAVPCPRCGRSVAPQGMTSGPLQEAIVAKCGGCGAVVEIKRGLDGNPRAEVVKPS